MLIKPIVHCGWDPGVKDFQVPVEIFCDGAFVYYSESPTMKILWLNEPREILPGPYEYARKNHEKYDYILTWDADLLSEIGNAVYFRNDMCWIQDYNVSTQKQFGVSTVTGFKRQTVGHILRHDLWNRRAEISIPKVFFASVYGSPSGLDYDPVLGDSKLPLFDYQFHIAIENVSSRNMISEKLNDACRTKTVPIYWGCPNVEDTYDPRGILSCNNVDDIIKTCNSLTPDTYQVMLPYIEYNYQQSINLISPDRSSKISETIEVLINTRNKE